jgi:5-methyltetrahydrofolate--homocysteine methyltransferase
VLEGLSLAAITPYLDWTFLFTAWELKGRFPDILDHPRYGSEARKLHQDAEGLLKRIVDSKLLEARAVYGFWHANSDGNDIVVWHDHTRSRELARFPMLRQQLNRETQQPRLCLSDFVAPLESGIGDFIGAFGLTTGIGAQELVRTLKLERGDFEAILAQLLAARLAEALSEFLHERVRREWGYGKTEQLSAQERLAGKYRGIRPAFGYPACPDHTEKARLLNFLEASAIGITLTENFAMLPAASASGIYLSHPQSRYFSLGKIAKDQVQDYARRKSMPISEVERWLAPNLGYER